ncbi:MAG TPA: hypothetical protein VFO05_07815 [Candidatus Limnocylindrales bacterium]|nr:hypothetical protein [Candidatus Limnocylindrales bacterium]
MHKPPLLIMRSLNNSGHLKDLGNAFEAEDPPINIRAIGGAEVEGTGVFLILIDDDTEERRQRVREIAGTIGIEHVELSGVVFEVVDEPGALGDAAETLEDAGVNVHGLLVVGAVENRAIVLAGVENDEMAEAARTALDDAEYTVYPAEYGHEAAP